MVTGCPKVLKEDKPLFNSIRQITHISCFLSCYFHCLQQQLETTFWAQFDEGGRHLELLTQKMKLKKKSRNLTIFIPPSTPMADQESV